MRLPVFVEILSRSKEVRHRHRVGVLPISIGRGYDNDIILDDPLIAEHHAVVDQDADGGLIIRDQNSLNGILSNGKRKTELVLDGNTIVTLGHTSLRVRSSDFNIEEELAVSRFHNCEGWLPAFSGLMMIAILTSIYTWMINAEIKEPTYYPLEIVTVLCVGIAWSGIWASANRLFGKSTRFGRHLFIFGCGFTAILLWDFVACIIAYSLSFELITRYSSHVSIAILAVIVFFHLQHIKPYRTRYNGVCCIVLSVIGSGIMLVVNYNSDNRLADELFMHERLPPVFRLSDNKPVTVLLNDAAKLKAKVDNERTKEGVRDEEDNKEKE